jgi:hypothetical protein
MSKEASINLLELLTILFQWLVLEQAAPSTTLCHASVAVWSDNTTAVHWTTKLRSSSNPIAGRVLTALATRLHFLEAAPFNVDHIAGIDNTMADVASRQHPTSTASFLTHFTSLFPPPQDNYWTLCRLNTKLTNKVFSLLQTKPPPMASWHQPLRNNPVFGQLGSPTSTKITQVSALTFKTSHAAKSMFCWELTQCTSAGASTNPNHDGSGVKRSRWHYEPLERSVHWTENRIPWSRRKGDIIYPLPESSAPSNVKTLPRDHN